MPNTIIPPPPEGEQSPTSAPSSPTATIVRPLQKGCRGPDVAEWQRTLKHLGFDPTWIDGIFGDRTDRSTEQLQIVAGLMPTGIVDMRTRAAAASMDPPSAPDTVKTPPDLQVPRITRRWSLEQVLSALRAGHLELFGSALEPKAARVAIAQLQLEHYDDFRAIHNNNLGNHMKGSDWTGPWFAMTATELIDGQWVEKRSKWRSYAEPVDGGKAYWTRLRDMWPTALSRLEAGNPIDFATYLKLNPHDGSHWAGAYYSDALDDYRNKLLAKWRKLALP